jgi:hypothetical protein
LNHKGHEEHKDQDLQAQEGTKSHKKVEHACVLLHIPAFVFSAFLCLLVAASFQRFPLCPS